MVKQQPEINIGLIGHVDHGKTTLTERLTGKWTDTHSEEIKRGITIRLGYANASFYKCPKCKSYGVKEKCDCNNKATLLRSVSFIDAPGHESLMATMISGAAIMDGAILLIAANEECPQPQTKEHLMALEIIGCKNIVVVQNKIDLVTKEEAIKNHKQIKEFLKNTIAKDAPIIPVSAQQNININYLVEAIENTIKTPKRDGKKPPLMFLARSFDINKPSTEINNLVGGVLGGVIKQGALKTGDKIIMLPGMMIEKEGKKEFKPIKTKIIGLKTGTTTIKEAHPGGSIAVLTSIDPYYIKGDSMTGNILGFEGKMPPVREELALKSHLLERVVGTKKDCKIAPIKISEPLMLNVNASVTVGVVTKIKKNIINVKLKIPICASKDDRITISRMIENRWRLIGYGIIQ